MELFVTYNVPSDLLANTELERVNAYQLISILFFVFHDYWSVAARENRSCEIQR